MGLGLRGLEFGVLLSGFSLIAWRYTRLFLVDLHVRTT